MCVCVRESVCVISLPLPMFVGMKLLKSNVHPIHMRAERMEQISNSCGPSQSPPKMVIGRLLIVLMMGCRLQFCRICSSESCRSFILWSKERDGDTEETPDSPISASERKRS